MFCKGAMATIRKVWDSITPEVELAVEEITAITGKIKAIEQNPTVEQLIAIIPNGSKYEDVLNIALDEINGIADEVKNVCEKISEWLSGKTELQKNADLFKLASVATSVADGKQGQESFYDSAVQLHVMVAKD